MAKAANNRSIAVIRADKSPQQARDRGEAVTHPDMRAGSFLAGNGIGQHGGRDRPVRYLDHGAPAAAVERGGAALVMVLLAFEALAYVGHHARPRDRRTAYADWYRQPLTNDEAN